MENINSGSADVDEAVQQVNHYCHASAKEVGIQKTSQKILCYGSPQKDRSSSVCVSQVSLSLLSGSQVDSLLERLESACTGES